MPLVIDQKDLDRLPITIDPEIVSGTPVFRGTRVPVEALISNLEAGLTLDEFLTTSRPWRESTRCKCLNSPRPRSSNCARLREDPPRRIRPPLTQATIASLGHLNCSRDGLGRSAER
jgi:hypothetical protein